jgi:hypothetical protein
MGYKQEKSIIQGTDKHKSALKFNFGKAYGKELSSYFSGIVNPKSLFDRYDNMEVTTALGAAIPGFNNIKSVAGIGKGIYNAFTGGSKDSKKSTSKIKTKPTSKIKTKSKLPTYEQSYTSEVADKWKDKGGKKAYIQAAKDWNAKNRK